MDPFWDEFETGEIHFRDKWQFELKSDFFPLRNLAQNTYSQEFFIFVPNALQVTRETYSRKQFYQDLTNLIRYKTPNLSLKDLVNPNKTYSPLSRLSRILQGGGSLSHFETVERELKLYANIFRSTLRKQAYHLIRELDAAHTPDENGICALKVEVLINEILAVFDKYDGLKAGIEAVPSLKAVNDIFQYVENTVSISINYSLTALLQEIRRKHDPIFEKLDRTLCQLLLKEKKYRETHLAEPALLGKKELENESVLYQSGLLNKFIVDALMLKTRRLSIEQKFGTLIGSVSAALAILLYTLLFIWQGSLFTINSLPFIIFSVFIYVIRERFKEEIKVHSYKQAARWFPDYTTEIQSPEGEYIGKMHESFFFIEPEKVPDEITKARNKGFHAMLEAIKRPEQVLYYKKNLSFQQNPKKKPKRLNALNIIFRLDIHRFMAKSSNAYEQYMTLDAETMEISEYPLPKVYHLNIILKNSYFLSDGSPKTEFKKYRLVVDKDGIKRVENLSGNNSYLHLKNTTVPKAGKNVRS